MPEVVAYQYSSTYVSRFIGHLVPVILAENAMPKATELGLNTKQIIRAYQHIADYSVIIMPLNAIIDFESNL